MKNSIFIDYTLLLLVIFVSGVPNFSQPNLFIPLFIILFSVFLFRNIRIDSKFILFLLLLLVITIFQTYIFNYYSIESIIGVFLRVIIAYLIVKILDKRFVPYFINIFYVIAIISLIIFIPVLVFPNLGNVLLILEPFFQIINFSSFEQVSIIIYNLEHIMTFRNPGPFWEPGAFGGYLIIAFIFNSFYNNSTQKKIALVLLMTIITTLSTTAYISIFVFIFLLYIKKIKNVLIKFIVTSVLLFSSYITYYSLDFLGSKIESQIEIAKDVNDPYIDNTNTQRFLNIMRDLEDFKSHEIFGRGPSPVTRYSYEMDYQIRTVGLTDILVRVGLPFFILIMFMLFQSFRLLTTYYHKAEILNGLGGFLAILIILMSQTYFNQPLIWCLLFIQFVYKRPKMKKLRLVEFESRI